VGVRPLRTQLLWQVVPAGPIEGAPLTRLQIVFMSRQEENETGEPAERYVEMRTSGRYRLSAVARSRTNEMPGDVCLVCALA